MEIILFIFLAIVLTSSIAYLSLIASYCYAWTKITVPPPTTSSPKTKVTIIVAARNEERTIKRCILSLLQQDYPNTLYEIIIVDDASEDNTKAIIQQYCEQNTLIQLISLDSADGKTGKKHALQTAIKKAKGDLIVCTDADCTMGKYWLSTIVNMYEQSNAKMIVGPVCYDDEKNSFEKMQSLEFISLIASGGASIYYNKALLCNGANLAYAKNTFEEVNGFEGIDSKDSGDDVLLMYKIEKKYPGKIKFLKQKDAIVSTKAKRTWSDFIHQRKRWASKEFSSMNTTTKLVSLIVYSFNTSIILLFGLGLFYSPDVLLPLSFFKIGLILFALKCFFDFLFLFLTTSFFGKKQLLPYFIIEQIVYIAYIFVIGILGSVGNYHWKGRKGK